MIEELQNQYSHAVVTQCREGRTCRLAPDGLGTHVILKGEDLNRPGRICDCVIFTADGELIVALVELKGKNPSASDAEEQLQNGADFALQALQDCGWPYHKCTFHHIVLHSGIHISAHRVLSNKKITVRGQGYRIMIARCGQSFAAIMAQYGFSIS